MACRPLVKDTQSRAQRNKEVRQNQVNVLHTRGSRSFAVVSHQLERELGRAPSRVEMYVVTRTKANGEALNEDCQQKIDVIRERIDNDESLVTKSIDDDDLYAELFPKEQKGRIRGLGLLPGGSKSIALARATAGLKQMEFENEDLRERMENAERRCEISEQNYIELKNMLLAMQGANSLGVGSTGANNGAESGGANDCARSSGADPNSPVDVALDTIAQHMNVEERTTSFCARNGSQSFDNGKRSRANGQKEGKHNHNNMMGPTDLPIDNIAQSTIANKGTTSVCAKNGGQPIDNGKRSFVANGHKEGTISRKSVLGRTTTNSLQLQSSSSDNGIIARGLDQTKIRKLGQNQDGDGKEVALRSLTGPMIVAYGRLKCTNKKAKGVDGQSLGEFYEVIVDVVLDRNVLLPRVHGQTTKLGAAIGCCIAWPFQNVVQKDGSALNMSKRAIDFR